MMFWALVVLAAAPLLMAAIVFLALRKGGLHRLHERRTGDDAGPVEDD